MRKKANQLCEIIESIIKVYDNENWKDLKILWEFINDDDIVAKSKESEIEDLLSKSTAWEYLKEYYRDIVVGCISSFTGLLLPVNICYITMAIILMPLVTFILCDVGKLIVRFVIKIIERKRNVVIIETPAVA